MAKSRKKSSRRPTEAEIWRSRWELLRLWLYDARLSPTASQHALAAFEMVQRELDSIERFHNAEETAAQARQD